MFQFFPRYLVKVVRHEDLRKHFADTINSIFGFIGVDSSRTIRNKERNPIRVCARDDSGRATRSLPAV